MVRNYHRENLWLKQIALIAKEAAEEGKKVDCCLMNPDDYWSLITGIMRGEYQPVFKHAFHPHGRYKEMTIRASLFVPRDEFFVGSWKEAKGVEQEGVA